MSLNVNAFIDYLTAITVFMYKEISQNSSLQSECIADITPCNTSIF